MTPSCFKRTRVGREGERHTESDSSNRVYELLGFFLNKPFSCWKTVRFQD